MIHASFILLVAIVTTLQLVACGDQEQLSKVEKKTSDQKPSSVPGDLRSHESSQDKALEHKVVPVPKILGLSFQHESVYIGKPLDANDRSPSTITDSTFESLEIGEPLDAYDQYPVQQHSKQEHRKEIGDHLDAYDLNNVQADNPMHNKIMIGEKLDADAPYKQNSNTRINP